MPDGEVNLYTRVGSPTRKFSSLLHKQTETPGGEAFELFVVGAEGKRGRRCSLLKRALLYVVQQITKTKILVDQNGVEGTGRL